MLSSLTNVSRRLGGGLPVLCGPLLSCTLFSLEAPNNLPGPLQGPSRTRYPSRRRCLNSEMQSPSLGSGPGPGAPGASRLASAEREGARCSGPQFPHRQRERKGAPQGTPVATGPKRRQVWPPPPPQCASRAWPPAPTSPSRSRPSPAPRWAPPSPQIRFLSSAFRSPSAPPSQPQRAEPPATPPRPAPPAHRTPRGPRRDPAPMRVAPLPRRPTSAPPHRRRYLPHPAPLPWRVTPWTRPRPQALRPPLRRGDPRTRRPTAFPSPTSIPSLLLPLRPSPLCCKWSPPQAGKRAPRPSICCPLRLASLHRPYRPDPFASPQPMSFRKSFSLVFNVKVINRK